MRNANRLLPVLFLAACGNPNPTPADDCVAAGTCPKDMATPRPMPDIALTCSPACAAPTPYCNDALHCVPCLVDAHCPAGQVCEKRGDLSVCVEGCADDSRCQRDGGATMACCDKHCVDTTSDPANCGGCGKVCTGTHGQAACAGSQCQTGKCDTGWGDCNSDPKDGCETNVHIDPANCGACGMTCSIPNAITACSDGCYLAACNFGWADCNGDPSDGCELDVTNDMKNCGGCGLLCNNKPRARNSCIASSCVVIACDPGYSDCNGDTSDGCEVATATDLKNCGTCGNVCAQGLVCTNGNCTCPQCHIPNAKSKCINNQCALESCLPGFGDCDNNAMNGCEANLTTDAANCGACGNACPMDAPKCSASKCTNLWAPAGVQQNTDIGQLIGWTQCYKDTYDVDLPVQQVLGQCTSSKLMLACRETNSQTFTLLAWAPRADVIFDTGWGNDGHVANDVQWYFSEDWSWGFAAVGDALERNSCDVGWDDSARRMCWHTGQGVGGYRCGDNYPWGADWERLVYQAD